MKIQFDRCETSFRSGLERLVASEFADVKDRALADGAAFLSACRDQTVTWAGQLAGGEITKSDFEWNLRSLADLAKMDLLRQIGLAEARRQAFRQRLISLLISSALTMVAA